MGARPLRRAIQRLVEDPLSDHILGGGFPEGSAVTIDRDGDEMSVTVVEAPPATAAEAPGEAAAIGATATGANASDESQPGNGEG
jgi:ATP-dependent Clp protease ATP-binding subunit ClpC